MKDIQETDGNPNGLMPAKPKAKRLSGKLLAGIVGVACALILVQVYSMFSQSPRTADKQQQKHEQTVPLGANAPLIKSQPEGGGMATPPAPEPAPRMAEALSPTSLPDALTPSPEFLAWQQEREQMRQMKRQLALQALQSPLTLSAANTRTETSAAPNYIPVQTQPLQSGLNVNAAAAGQDYDVADRKDKEEFLAQRSRAESDWTLGHTRTPGARFELKTGSVLPGLMLTGLNSDLPGQIIGQVSRNVYDSATGRFLLVPQGSRLIGRYDSRVALGQRRVLIAWQRLVFPDGSSLTLESMPGADQAGFAGLNDKTNNHYGRVFGTAILMSLITGGMSYSLDALSDSTSDSDNPSLQDEMGTALASQLGQASLQLLQQNATIKPTLEIRPGMRFNVVLVKDLVFERPYAAMTPRG